MYDIMFSVFEASFIMTGAIVILAFTMKLLRHKIKASKRHIIWVLIALVLFVPIRPLDFAMFVTVPQATTGVPIENTETTSHDTNETRNR